MFGHNPGLGANGKKVVTFNFVADQKSLETMAKELSNSYAVMLQLQNLPPLIRDNFIILNKKCESAMKNTAEFTKLHNIMLQHDKLFNAKAKQYSRCLESGNPSKSKAKKELDVIIDGAFKDLCGAFKAINQFEFYSPDDLRNDLGSVRGLIENCKLKGEISESAFSACKVVFTDYEVFIENLVQCAKTDRGLKERSHELLKESGVLLKEFETNINNIVMCRCSLM